MSEIWFYHLQTQPLETVLPELLEKSIARGWRSVVQSGDESQLDQLDQLLWTYQDESFLPHGRSGDPHAERQPILITADMENPNSAQIRFLVFGAPISETHSYERSILLFDGNDPAAVDQARSDWKILKAQNETVVYWRQDDDGRWKKMA